MSVWVPQWKWRLLWLCARPFARCATEVRQFSAARSPCGDFAKPSWTVLNKRLPRTGVMSRSLRDSLRQSLKRFFCDPIELLSWYYSPYSHGLLTVAALAVGWHAFWQNDQCFLLWEGVVIQDQNTKSGFDFSQIIKKYECDYNERICFQSYKMSGYTLWVAYS